MHSVSQWPLPERLRGVSSRDLAELADLAARLGADPLLADESTPLSDRFRTLQRHSEGKVGLAEESVLMGWAVSVAGEQDWGAPRQTLGNQLIGRWLLALRQTPAAVANNADVFAPLGFVLGLVLIFGVFVRWASQGEEAQYVSPPTGAYEYVIGRATDQLATWPSSDNPMIQERIDHLRGIAERQLEQAKQSSIDLVTVEVLRGTADQARLGAEQWKAVGEEWALYQKHAPSFQGASPSSFLRALDGLEAAVERGDLSMARSHSATAAEILRLRNDIGVEL